MSPPSVPVNKPGKPSVESPRTKIAISDFFLLFAKNHGGRYVSSDGCLMNALIIGVNEAGAWWGGLVPRGGVRRLGHFHAKLLTRGKD